MENPAVSENNPMDPHGTYARKPKRVRMFKDDVVAENTTLKARVKELENWIDNFKAMPTMKRVGFALGIGGD